MVNKLPIRAVFKIVAASIGAVVDIYSVDLLNGPLV